MAPWARRFRYGRILVTTRSGISRDAKTASLSHVGRVREMNQDVCGEFSSSTHRLLVVADGMGGHSGGETASRLALETIGATFDAGFDDPVQMLTDAFHAANREIHRLGSEDATLHGMGTTGVALLLGPGRRAWVAHVGDSRAYQLSGGQLRQITEDHSWVSQEVRNHRIAASEADTHPMKNVLLRSIGVGDRVEVSVAPVKAGPGDRFLLCSDGLWGEVPSESISEILAGEDPRSVVQMLVDLANDCGGSDNITVQVALIGQSLPEEDDEGEGDEDHTLEADFSGDTEPISTLRATRGTESRAVLSSRWLRPVTIGVGLLALALLFGRSACS